jgi:hypothetical protein
LEESGMKDWLLNTWAGVVGILVLLVAVLIVLKLTGIG